MSATATYENQISKFRLYRVSEFTNNLAILHNIKCHSLQIDVNLTGGEIGRDLGTWWLNNKHGRHHNSGWHQGRVDYPDETVDYIKISVIDDVEVMLLLNLMMSKLYCSKIEFSFGQTFFSEPRNVLKMFLIF